MIARAPRGWHVPVLMLSCAIPRPASASDAAMSAPDRPESARHVPTPALIAGGTPFDNALRLARMLGDEGTVARLLEQQAFAPDVPWPNVVDAVEALEEVGETEQAAQLLDRRARGAPRDTRALEALADLRARKRAALGPRGRRVASAPWPPRDR